MDDERVYIMDMYNRWIYPNDREAKGEGINPLTTKLPAWSPHKLHISEFILGVNTRRYTLVHGFSLF